MEVIYKNKSVEKKCNEKAVTTYGSEVAKGIYKALQALEAAIDLRDIQVQKRFALHQLKGDRKGEYSITLIKRSGMRMILVPMDDKIEIKEIQIEKINKVRIEGVEDYHD